MTDTQTAEKHDAKENLVDIEVEAEEEEEGKAAPEGETAEAAADDATASSESEQTDDDDDDDDEEDERLSADQRDEKHRIKRQRAKERRRQAMQQSYERIQQAELRAARAELAARKTELNMAVFQARSQSEMIDRQAADMQARFQRAQRIKADAISKNDGARATQADYELQQIQQQYAQLNEQKLRASESLRNLGAHAQEIEAYERRLLEGYSDGGQVEQEAERPRINADGQKLAKKFMETIPWYKPGVKAGDSAIVDTIDVVLMREGFDPNAKEYWDEFSRRLKAALPDKFKAPKNPSPPVAGGRDTTSTAKTKMRIPKEAMETMRQAGIIDEYNKVTDKKKFDNYLTRFKANMQAAKRAS